MDKLLLISLFLLHTVGFSQDGDRPNPSVKKEVQETYSESKPYELRGVKSDDKKTKKKQKRSRLEKKNEKWLRTENARNRDNLISFPITIYGANNKPAFDIGEEEITVFENGVEQKIKYFGKSVESKTIILVLDISPSFAYRAQEFKRVIKNFVSRISMRDRVMIVGFNKDVKVLTPPTNDKNKLLKRIEKIKYKVGGTSAYEAVSQICNGFAARIRGRKTIVIFSDGVDTTSRRSSYIESINDARKSNVMISSIYYNSRKDFYSINVRKNKSSSVPNILRRSTLLLGLGTSTREYEIGRRYMHDLIFSTGGRVFNAGESDIQIKTGFNALFEAIQTQKYIEYISNQEMPAKGGRRIKVRVSRPNLIVHTRDRYFPNR